MKIYNILSIVKNIRYEPRYCYKVYEAIKRNFPLDIAYDYSYAMCYEGDV